MPYMRIRFLLLQTQAPLPAQDQRPKTKDEGRGRALERMKEGRKGKTHSITPILLMILLIDCIL
jgi:hypothetical protein